MKAHPELLGQNMFPASLPDGDFRLPTERYYAAVLDLSMRVLEILAKGLPYGDDIFHEFVSNDPVCIMRLLHYPPQAPLSSRDHKRQLGAGAHTDFGMSRLTRHFSSRFGIIMTLVIKMIKMMISQISPLLSLPLSTNPPPLLFPQPKKDIPLTTKTSQSKQAP